MATSRTRTRPASTRQRGLAVVATLLAAGLALTACSKEPEVIQPTDPPVTVDPEVQVDKTAAPEAAPVWPLTGLPGDVVERPVLAVKVETTRPARPQAGINVADVLWEEMIEGGETRLLAMFHSSLPEQVGPIRSVRPMDGGIVGPTGGLLAFSGGQPQFIQQVIDDGVQVTIGDQGGPGMYRVDFRRTPYNLYGNPAEMITVADGNRNLTPPAPFTFAATPAAATAAANGTEATEIVAKFPAQKSSWNWDGSRWLRSMSDAPHTVDTGEQIAADNVVVLRVNIRDTGAKDPIGTAVYETIMVDSGEALVATGGRTVSGTWSKAGISDPIVLTGADGQVITLAPGQTFIELLPYDSSSLTVS
ncbi:hypothetical protein EDD28_0660 [Salana multivorans]|uniref:DUF3048 family protein n=1 Tax=Salana multivorans TaxID=120377 RepID=A0A3N2D8G9_9MICO|nr:DUF3048 domain-containing protein [Salana multivorans]ROR96086.1 hypothetical protein EDD28_0660 [Salana multivorans]